MAALNHYGDLIIKMTSNFLMVPKVFNFYLLTKFGEC